MGERASRDCGDDLVTPADESARRGWLLGPQPPSRGGPSSLHLSLCAVTTTTGPAELLDRLTRPKEVP